MNKRSLVILSCCLIIGVVLTNVVIANPGIWGLIEKKEGNYIVENGVPVKYYGDDDINKVVDSIDPITAVPTLTLSDLFWDNNAKIKILETQINGEQVDFKFRTQPEVSEEMLFSVPGQNYQLTSIPNSNKYIMEYKTNLYIVDAEQSLITPFLLDNIGEYDIKQLESKLIKDHFPMWGTNPYVSPDGSKVVFHSTRNVLTGGSPNGQMWVKYLDNSDEYPVMEGGFNFIGFGLDDNVFYKSGDSINKINLKSKESELIINFSLYAANWRSSLIYQSDYNILYLYDTQNKEKKELVIKDLGVIHNIWTYNNSPNIIIENQPDRTIQYSELIIFNLETNEYNKLDAPKNTDFINVGWIDHNQFIVTVHLRESNKDETYIINLKDVN